jgi:hypothetical protein
MKDILLSEDLDVVFEGKDLAFGQSAQQELALVMLTEKGEWKNNPFVGLGLRRLEKSSGSPVQLASQVRDAAETARVGVSLVEIMQTINVYS